MFDKLKAEWQALKRAPAGKRFVECYARHQARDAPWLKPFLFFAAIFSFVIGIVLAFIPGPAILFFAISAALLAAEYRPVAAAFDKIEVWLRGLIGKYRGRRRKNDSRAKTRAGKMDPEMWAQLQAAGRTELPREPEVASAPTPTPVHVEPPASGPQSGSPIDMSNLHIPGAEPAPAPVQTQMPAPQPAAATVIEAPAAPAGPVDMSRLQVPGAPPTPPPSPAVMAAASRRKDVWWMPKAEAPSASPDVQMTQHPAATAPTSMEDLLAARQAREAQLAAAAQAFAAERAKTVEAPQTVVAEPVATQPPPTPVKRPSVRVSATVKRSVSLPPTPITRERAAPLMPRPAGTMKIWATAIEPHQPPVVLQNTQPEPPQLPANNSIVTLPPPAMIGEKKRSRPSVARSSDRRATPPPAPRS